MWYSFTASTEASAPVVVVLSFIYVVSSNNAHYNSFYFVYKRSFPSCGVIGVIMRAYGIWFLQQPRISTLFSALVHFQSVQNDSISHQLRTIISYHFHCSYCQGYNVKRVSHTVPCGIIFITRQVRGRRDIKHIYMQHVCLHGNSPSCLCMYIS